MANPYFKFKQFTVYHDKCAMKVGTDGVLIGAWADVSRAEKILDVGTGSGLIALMIAQRCDASVLGIDIDEDAVIQARENVMASQWSGQITIARQDVRVMANECDTKFDVILSNPPYFAEDVKCPEAQRNTARHTDELDFHSLLQAVSVLLTDDGTFSVVLPANAASDFIALATKFKLFLSKQTWVYTKPNMPAKRVLMAFSKDKSTETQVGHLTIETAPKVYTPEFAALMKDFYLFIS